MLSPEVRSRLEQLNRGPLPSSGPELLAAQQAQVSQIDPPAAEGDRSSRFSLAAALSQLGHVVRRAIDIEPPSGDSVLGTGSQFEVENSSGKHLRLRRPLETFWPQSSAHLVGRPSPTIREDQHDELRACSQALPDGLIFLDLETCGFAGSMVFLVGLLRMCGGRWTLDQLLAHNYAEERAVLETLWQTAAEHRVLITFNGKSFDWPMVHDRSTRHLIGVNHGELSQTHGSRFDPQSARPQLMHCDLLHHARRRWRGHLPNCRLQTLERYVCGRRRAGDIHGAEIPAAYHHYVRTGEDRQMRSVLHHNALDLVTLLELLLELLAADGGIQDAEAARG